jgi:hypothetical protein
MVQAAKCSKGKSLILTCPSNPSTLSAAMRSPIAATLNCGLLEWIAKSYQV